MATNTSGSANRPGARRRQQGGRHHRHIAAGHDKVALREIDRADGVDDQHETKRRQGVGGPEAEAGEQEFRTKHQASGRRV